MNTEQIKKTDQEFIAHTYGRFNVAIVEGKGMRCKDPEGKEYLDMTSGIGVNSLGFCDEGWTKAVCEQVMKLQHISNLYYTEPCAALAEQICKKSGMSKVFFCNSGAEANEGAIKAARKYGNTRSDGKMNQILTLKDSFHGRTMATVTATGQDDYHKLFDPFVGGFNYCEANNIDDLKAKFNEDTCAIMIEMIQGEGGVNVLTEDFVLEAQKLCRENDALLIVDEVQTGVGRTGKLFAYQNFGLEPDIVTFAKGMAGGLPIGGVIFRENVSEVLVAGDHGSTFGGNPVSCAGGLEVMKRLDSAMLDNIASMGAYLKEQLTQIPGVEKVDGIGLMLGFTVDGIESKELLSKCLENGLMVLTAKDKIRLLPPLIIKKEDVDQAIAILKKSIEEMK